MIWTALMGIIRKQAVLWEGLSYLRDKEPFKELSRCSSIKKIKVSLTTDWKGSSRSDKGFCIIQPSMTMKLVDLTTVTSTRRQGNLRKDEQRSLLQTGKHGVSLRGTSTHNARSNSDTYAECQFVADRYIHRGYAFCWLWWVQVYFVILERLTCNRRDAGQYD